MAYAAKNQLTKNKSRPPQCLDAYIQEGDPFITNTIGSIMKSFRLQRVQSDEELKDRLQDYFNICTDDAQLPTMEGMALHCGYTVFDFCEFANGKRGFSPETAQIIKTAKSVMMTFDAQAVEQGRIPFLAYCFRAKNYYGMRDQQEVILSPSNALGEQSTPEEIEKRILSDDYNIIDVTPE